MEVCVWGGLAEGTLLLEDIWLAHVYYGLHPGTKPVAEEAVVCRRRAGYSVRSGLNGG